MKGPLLACTILLAGVTGYVAADTHPEPSRRWIPGADMAIEGIAENDEGKYDIGHRRLQAKADSTTPTRVPSGIVHREKACLDTLVALHPARHPDPPLQRRQQYYLAAEQLIGGANGLILMAVMGGDERAVLSSYVRAADGFRQQDDAKARTEIDGLRRFPRTPENILLASGIIELGIAQIGGRALSSQDIGFLSQLCSYPQNENPQRNTAPTSTTLANLNRQRPFSRELEREYLQLLAQAQRRPEPDRVETAAIRMELAFRYLVNPDARSWSKRRLKDEVRKAVSLFEVNVAELQDDRSPAGARLLLASMGLAFQFGHAIDPPSVAQRPRVRQEAERLLEFGAQLRTLSTLGYYTLLSTINKAVRDDEEANQHPSLVAYRDECEKQQSVAHMAEAMNSVARCSPEMTRFMGNVVPWAYSDDETRASIPEIVFDDVSQAVRTHLKPLDDGKNGGIPEHLDDEKDLRALILRGRHAQAEVLALGLLRSGDADNLSLARAHMALGEIDIHRGRYASGVMRVSSAERLFDGVLPGSHPDRSTSRALLARGHAALNELAKASELYRSLTTRTPRISIERISFKLLHGEPITTDERLLLDRIRNREDLPLISLDAHALRARIRHAGLPSTGKPKDDITPDYEALILRTRSLLGPDSPREALFRLQAALEAKRTGNIAQAVQSATTALAILQRNPAPESAVSATDPAWWFQPTQYVAEQALLIVTDAAASGSANLDHAFVAMQLLHRNEDAPALHSVRARLAATATTQANIREYEQLLGRLIGRSSDDGIDTAQQGAPVLARLDALRSEIQAAHPAYFTLLSDSIVDAALLRDRLTDSTIYYQITVVGDAYYGIVLTKDGGRTIRLTSIRETDASVDALLDSVQRWESARSTPFAREAAEHLHRLLIAPIATELSTHRRIVLVAATRLSALPFAALRTPEAGTGYLGLSHAIVSAPSASSWFGLATRTSRSRTFVPLLGLGNPRIGALSISSRDFAQSPFVFRGVDMSATQDQREAILALPALPETADEIESIARVLAHADNKVLLGSDATEADVRTAIAHPYATLAFSTHGITLADGAGFEEPGLVMTPPSTVTRTDDDGFLAASEVAGLQLSAELVLLAACSTDRASEGAGGSLGPLVRAFHFAGANQLLATRWKIDSQATVDLITAFVRALNDQPESGAAEALRVAASTLAANPTYGDPRFWAAFHVSGGW